MSSIVNEMSGWCIWNIVSVKFRFHRLLLLLPHSYPAIIATYIYRTLIQLYVNAILRFLWTILHIEKFNANLTSSVEMIGFKILFHLTSSLFFLFLQLYVNPRIIRLIDFPIFVDTGICIKWNGRTNNSKKNITTNVEF